MSAPREDCPMCEGREPVEVGGVVQHCEGCHDEPARHIEVDEHGRETVVVTAGHVEFAFPQYDDDEWEEFANPPFIAPYKRGAADS